MAMLKGRRVVLGVTGSIAAYKSAFLVRELVKAGAQVRVVMTPGAREFITPLTLGTLSGHPVHSELTDDRDAGTWTDHVELGLWGDVILVAPATAPSLAWWKATASFWWSAQRQVPVVVAPAMDRDMFTHPATTNLNALRERGSIIEPEEGELASGLEGKGASPTRPHPRGIDRVVPDPRAPWAPPSSRWARPTNRSTPSASSATAPPAAKAWPSPSNSPAAA